VDLPWRPPRWARAAGCLQPRTNPTYLTRGRSIKLPTLSLIGTSTSPSAQYTALQQAMQETMAYFDLLNLTENIRRPALVDIGRKDVTYPYRTVMPRQMVAASAYASGSNRKTIRVRNAIAISKRLILDPLLPSQFWSLVWAGDRREQPPKASPLTHHSRKYDPLTLNRCSPDERDCPESVALWDASEYKMTP